MQNKGFTIFISVTEFIVRVKSDLASGPRPGAKVWLSEALRAGEHRPRPPGAPPRQEAVEWELLLARAEQLGLVQVEGGGGGQTAHQGRGRGRGRAGELPQLQTPRHRGPEVGLQLGPGPPPDLGRGLCAGLVHALQPRPVLAVDLRVDALPAVPLLPPGPVPARPAVLAAAARPAAAPVSISVNISICRYK